MIVSRKIQKVLMENNKSTQALRFQSLYAKLLTQHPILTQHGSLLYLLFRLNGFESSSWNPLSNSISSTSISSSIIHPIAKQPTSSSSSSSSPTIVKKEYTRILHDYCPSNVSEKDLIKSILYAFQGIPSDNIQQNTQKEWKTHATPGTKYVIDNISVLK